MAELVAILATTHHPFYYATSKLPPEQAPPFTAEWVRKVEAYRETLARARPDIPMSCGSTTRSRARSSPCGRRTTCRSC